ncbi:MAG TPA: SPOR domain-containing protein [Blastocatellia bacterium]|nr:SPOR domain-containing protein [Blastocatellia bacterium]
MYSRQCLFTAALLISFGASSVPGQSEAPATYFTLQVASFPDTELANKFVIQLVREGEHPTCATIELQGRGYWTRVFLGLFPSAEAARRYGDNLKARGTIVEFLIRKAELNEAVTRPRRVTPSDAASGPISPTSTVQLSGQNRPPTDLPILSSFDIHDDASMRMRLKTKAVEAAVVCPQPVNRSEIIPPVIAARYTRYANIAPSVDTARIPRPDPVALAFRLVVEMSSTASVPPGPGGLWLSGDTAEGLSRLRWIIGDENAGLITLDEGGRVQLDRRRLAKAAGLGAVSAEDPLQVADYVVSNEGLLLLVQLVEGSYRYLLHIGNQVPTRGRNVEISGGINLDNNFDSRINPYRKYGKKLDEERPPEGFAALIALNPVAQWFNLSTREWVQVGEITLHELAEAHAKVALGLDYLEQGSSPGAHALALQRERRLKSQRPDEDIVLTAGSNRVLRTQQEIRLFYAESGGENPKQ